MTGGQGWAGQGGAAWGDDPSQRPQDPDATGVLPAVPDRNHHGWPVPVDPPTQAYPTVRRAGRHGEAQPGYGQDPSPYGWPSDATVQQPRLRGPEEYPGGFDDTYPLPRYEEPPTRWAPPPAAPGDPAGRVGGNVGGGRHAAHPGDRVPDFDGYPAPPAPGEPGPAGPAGDPAVEEGGTSVARHGAVMALGSVISRVTGFMRTAAIGAAIGAVAIGDDYTLANLLPGMVYELLLGGVLASVVVPLLVRARTRDADRGEAYTQRLLSLAVVFLAGATVLAVLCAPLFTAMLASSRMTAADRHLTTTLSYLVLPMIFFYGMAALFAAVLNTRNHFAMPTFAPILNNLVVIGMCASFILLIPISDADKNNAGSLSTQQIVVLGLGTTLGIVVQAAGLVPVLRRVGFRWKWRWDFRQLRLSELGRVSSWMLAYVVVSQIAVIVINKLAQAAATANPENRAAGPFIYNNAFLIFMMAHGIVAVSVITALMPRMSAAAAEDRHADLADHLSLGTRLTAVVLVPATIGYVVLGRPLAVTLFEWRNYTNAEALSTGNVIAVAGLGLIPFAMSQLQLFSFYAMPDTKTPALINVPAVAMRLGIDLLLFVALPATLFAAGLMLGNAISFVVAAALGYLLLRRRIGRLGLSQVLSTVGRLLIAGVIAAVPTAAVLVVLSVVWGTGKIPSFVELVVCGAILLGSYLAIATRLRVPEVGQLTGMVRSRLHR